MNPKNREKILIHLLRHFDKKVNNKNDYINNKKAIAPWGICEEGISRGTGIRYENIGRDLKYLEEKDYLKSRKSRIKDMNKRTKIFILTESGKEAANDLVIKFPYYKPEIYLDRKKIKREELKEFLETIKEEIRKDKIKNYIPNIDEDFKIAYINDDTLKLEITLFLSKEAVNFMTRNLDRWGEYNLDEDWEIERNGKNSFIDKYIDSEFAHINITKDKFKVVFYPTFPDKTMLCGNWTTRKYKENTVVNIILTEFPDMPKNFQSLKEIIIPHLFKIIKRFIKACEEYQKQLIEKKLI